MVNYSFVASFGFHSFEVCLLYYCLVDKNKNLKGCLLKQYTKRKNRRLGFIKSLHIQLCSWRSCTLLLAPTQTYSISKVTRIGSMIPKALERTYKQQRSWSVDASAFPILDVVFFYRAHCFYWRNWKALIRQTSAYHPYTAFSLNIKTP